MLPELEIAHLETKERGKERLAVTQTNAHTMSPFPLDLTLTVIWFNFLTIRNRQRDFARDSLGHQSHYDDR